MTKKQKEKLNKMFDDNVIDIALDHSDFTGHAHDHWKEYLRDNYESPSEWAQENLSPDKIKDLLNGMDLIGADFKKEV